MAVENKYVDSNVASGKKAAALLAQGAQTFVMVQTFEVAAADDNGSIYRVFKNVNPNYVPVRLDIICDAIAGMTDVNVGFYKSLERGGADVDENALADALDFSSAVLRSAPLDGLKAVNAADAEKPIYELAGDTLATRELGYDIALTAVAAASAAGTITVVGTFAYKG
jgi:hypothetical protein